MSAEPTIRDEWVEKAAKAARVAVPSLNIRMSEKVSSTALAAVADDIRAEALQAAATSYQMGGWATLPQAAGSLATKRRQAEHAVAWLRDRADRIGGRHD